MKKNSVNLLPTFFRTTKNSKFLSSTLDQLIETPSLERLDGYYGSTLSNNYNPLKDQYINTENTLRDKYQLEPSLVIKDLDASIKKAYAYDDLINQLSFYGSDVSNLNRIFKPDFYSYDPNIDWDKLINYNQYYWLPNGPSPVNITGTQREITSTYSVTDSADGNYFIFSGNELIPDPQITLYRGVTYVFNVTSKNIFYIKDVIGNGPTNQYNDDVIGNGTSNGQVIFTVSYRTPSILYYAGNTDQVAGGQFIIKTVEENSYIDVEKEIVGKVNFTSSNGVKFINGIKVTFGGDVTPVLYRNKEFIVEGVGEKITLVDFSLLDTPESIATDYNVNFDSENFDDFPFDNFKNVPLTPAYITINRSSRDRNPWSRYNRWFHADVIKNLAIANGQEEILPINNRANRPIIEFKADLQLFNFGNNAIADVDLIDLVTTDAFSLAEKSPGYSIDGVEVEEGFRVIFNADPDPLVKSKIYEVHFVSINGDRKIDLVEIETPELNSSITIKNGTAYKGTVWHYTTVSGKKIWVKSQLKTLINQAPVFDVFDKDGYSYGSQPYTGNFKGTKIFGYAIGTGSADPVLKFPLQYQNVGIESSFLFINYFTTDIISRVFPNLAVELPVRSGFLKSNKDLENPAYLNVWTDAKEFNVPVVQFQVLYDSVSQIEITVFDRPGYISDIKVDVFVNNIKYSNNQYFLTRKNDQLFVNFVSSLSSNLLGNKIRFDIYTDQVPNSTGVYQVPLSLTNNPLNGPISQFTLTELYDHVNTMVDRNPEFIGTFPGSGNISSLPNISKYGTRIISNNNPLSFAHYFISNKDYNLIDSIKLVSDDYNQFKINFIKTLLTMDESDSAQSAVDMILSNFNENKNENFPYFLSDMVPYGTNKKTRVYQVTDKRNLEYSITSVFDPTTLSNTSILVYHNGIQLLIGRDYQFNLYDPTVHILVSVVKGDVITIEEYQNTDGSYVPPTPTKLGLYPKFQPMMYLDHSYADDPQYVIQGHDGSITVAFNDYRDNILLEYEKRIFNNIKTEYDPGIIDINSILPGAFRNALYSYETTYDSAQFLFLKWTGFYGIDYTTNNTFNINNHKTYNFNSILDTTTFNDKTVSLPGSWRAIYKYYFDTDRPDTHPWEMLGISIKPHWWDDHYGPFPYTAGNIELWKDLENGMIADGPNKGINTLYARPGLSKIIPVDDSGNLIPLLEWSVLSSNDSFQEINKPWAFNNWGPAENAWRRSSNWPFAVQIIMALSKPADYASKMFDTSRLNLNNVGQYTYGNYNEFLSPASLKIHGDVVDGEIVRAAGYSVCLVEIGKKRNSSFITHLIQDLQNGNFNLMVKLGGFASKDKLSVSIDSFQLTTQNPTLYIPNENYSVHFNVSNPIKYIPLSGVIVIKQQGNYIIKGYDKKDLFFKIYKSLHTINDNSISIGSSASDYVYWSENQLYTTGQIIFYESFYYKVIIDHNSLTSFNKKYYTAIPELPSVKGLSVLTPSSYETVETIIPYGIEMTSLQEVSDFLLGYSRWLEEQGFIFDEYSTDFNQTINWEFTVKEFLYWTTQNWADSSVITLSPFASNIKFSFKEGVVDNVLDSFYEYSILRADGLSFPSVNFYTARTGNTFVINTKNTQEGFFFIRLALVQKEHCLIFDNKTIFNDIIYAVDSGYKQSRIKLKGFKTSSWNGDYFSPGFIYDKALIQLWKSYETYFPGDVVEYVGKYYSAKQKITGSENFDATYWNLLNGKPEPTLIPNFDYKINQFEDFYSLDIDNFDLSQQKLAQHLVGYSPRSYLDNIFSNSISQYKFYQGYIREKGTRNSLTNLEKASTANLQGKLEFNEEWAFRVGYFGSYSSYNEIELPLREKSFVENSQLVQFVDQIPDLVNPLISYIVPTDLTITSDNYTSTSTFNVVPGTFKENTLMLPTAGYVRLDDIDFTLININALLNSYVVDVFQEGNKIWVGFDKHDEWNVYRYTRHLRYIISVSKDTGPTLTFTTNLAHGLQIGDLVSVKGMDPAVNNIYVISNIPAPAKFSVETKITSLPAEKSLGLLFKFRSVRFNNVDDLADLDYLADIAPSELFWLDNTGNNKWGVLKKVNNYNFVENIAPDNNPDQKFGYRIAKQEGNDRVIVSASKFQDTVGGIGRIYVYDLVGDVFKPIYNYSLNSFTDEYRPNSDLAPFGDNIFYDDTDNLIFSSAADASNIRVDTSGNVRYVKSTNLYSSYKNVGLVKISAIFKSPKTYTAEVVLAVLGRPATPQNNSRFGSGIHVQRSLGNKRVLIGAPKPSDTSINGGAVYRYDLSYSDNERIFYSVTGTNLNGVDASFDITVNPATRSYQVKLVNSGTFYYPNSFNNSFITITGDKLGGVAPINNLFVKIDYATTFINTSGILLSGGTTATIIGLTTATTAAMVPGAVILQTGGAANLINPTFIQSIDSDTQISVYSTTTTVRTTGTITFKSGGSIIQLSSTATTGTASLQSFSISAPSQTHLPSPFTTSDEHGFRVTGNKNADVVAASAPGYASKKGAVAVYLYNVSTDQYVWNQTIKATDEEYENIVREGDRLGTELVMSEDGQYLFVASSQGSSKNTRPGFVSVYKWNNNKFVFLQILKNPSKEANLQFGHFISINSSSTILSVTSQGTNLFNGLTFDKGKTTFDAKSCRIGDNTKMSGTAYVYNKINEKFLLAQELYDVSVDEESHYAESVVVNENKIFIGSPGSLSTNNHNGSVYVWDKIDKDTNSWNLYRNQTDLVDIGTVKKSFTVDTLSNQVVDYLDIIDPIKGRIPSLADREIRYKTPFDPAVYRTGTSSVVVDTGGFWGALHIGELWWDLSTTKYVWYEQGDVSYRKNTWGQLFPGTSIDIYEWVESTYSPTQWADLADTNEGLTIGISGIPKFSDGSVYSSVQVYDKNTGQFTTLYYFWVKNKVIVPSVDFRSISAYEISNLILDPKSYGLKYISIISPDAISVTNFKPNLISDRIHLNIASDVINNNIDKHTEWELVQENNEDSKPPLIIEQKMIDSLLGKDKLGNLVPDPKLSPRQRYGIEIRPKQGMFVNRIEALRNVIEYTNSILLTKLISGYVNFNNLNSKEEIPNIFLNEYDQLVEDIESRDVIITKFLEQSLISCSVLNGRIISVSIDYPGYGYQTAPIISIDNGYSIAEIKTSINENGQINGAIISNPGSGFITAPAITVRPYTVIVQVDSTVNNKWSKYEWNGYTWIRVHTQKYNTTTFWKYVDWSDSTYNKHIPLAYVVDEIYSLNTLTFIAGDYVKVKNPGDGKFIILRKTAEGVNGTFDIDFDIIYAQEGTIQILPSVWNTSESQFGFDQVSTFDQLVYDETSEIELQKIITAIKDDIFIGQLRIYWNKFFFKAIKYAMSEQSFVDWTFKTSFINARNIAGVLDQRSTYRFQDPTWYEDYLKEVKPYHTEIRNYQVNYQVGQNNDSPWELTNTYSTDFDLPSYYDKSAENFIIVNESNSLINTYPYQSWNENYKFNVDSITLLSGGSGYKSNPTVTIVPAKGDTGSGATAQAYIGSGKVTNIVLTNPGSGYIITPTVVISGGGDTSLTPAVAYARLSNKKVRNSFIQIKFDRITSNSSSFVVGSTTATVSTVTNGVNYLYDLSWYAPTDKSTIVVTIDGLELLLTDYSIVNKTELPNSNYEYHKKYSQISLNYIPEKGKVLEISYNKNIELYSAAERIRDYYKPTEGMAGNQLGQLMTGVDYPGNNIKGLEFTADSGWNGSTSTSNYGSDYWDAHDPDLFYSLVTYSTSTQTVTIPNLISAGSKLNVYIEGFDSNGVKIYNNRIDSTGTTTLVSTVIGLGYGTVSDVKIANPGKGYTGTVSLVISSPEISTGTAATASVSYNGDGVITGTNIINHGFGYLRAPSVTIVGAQSTTTNNISAYLVTKITPAFTLNGITTSTITISQAAFTATSAAFYKIVFRDSQTGSSATPRDLDSTLDGGDLAYTTALGYHPMDIIFDGDKFISPNTSHAPEEMIPGQIQESLSINVFTRDESGSPLIVTQSCLIDSTSTPTVVNLALQPVNTSSVMVSFNGTCAVYQENYTVNFVNSTVTINPQGVTGIAYITVIGVGGTEILGNKSLTSTALPSITLECPASYDDIGSIYLTVNGLTVSDNSELSYTLYPVSNTNRAAKLKIDGLNIYEVSLIQVWFFKGKNKSYSEVKEQIIQVTTSTSSFILTQMPGVLGPFHAQAIVELDGLRLTPPDTVYYEVKNNQTSFAIKPDEMNPPNIFDNSVIEVYRNGVKLTIYIDYLLLQDTSYIEFNQGYLSNGDVIAITALIGQDYTIANNQINLTSSVSPGNILKIITYTNSDSSNIRTEVYRSYGANLYKMSRSIINDNYVWVSIAGKPLIKGRDYFILSDLQTIEISRSYQHNLNDKIVVTSFSDKTISKFLGYRMFYDILGRVHYKRFSEINNTLLTKDLLPKDTTILVVDSKVLSNPSPETNSPGIIFIAGERIEYFIKDDSNNTLGQLRRGTLGTGVREIHSIGSTVVDSGRVQTISTNELTLVQNTSTTDTSTYLINDISSTLLGDAIILDTNLDLTSQVDVYYAGILLKKTTSTVHSVDISYDSDSSSDIIIDPEFTIISTGTINYVNLSLSPLKWPNGIEVGKRLTITKNTGQTWYTPGQTLSLLNEVTMEARFLQQSSSGIPDKYFYTNQISASSSPSSPILYALDESGVVITDETGTFLELD
jgi:hypothetical protein